MTLERGHLRKMLGDQSDFDFSEPAASPQDADGGGEADNADPGSADPDRFVGQLEAICGERLLSVLLHGPDADRAEEREEPPEYNFLVVLDAITVPDMDAVAGAVMEWTGLGQPVPLFFSQARLANAAAAFPVELLDLKECNRLLRGSDLISPLEVRKTNLLQDVERGLKSQVHRLCEARMLHMHSEAHFRAAVTRLLPRINLLIRSALRFYSPQNPESMLQGVRRMEIYLPGSKTGLLGLYAFCWAKPVEGAPNYESSADMLESVLSALQTLIAGIETLRAKRES